MRPVSIETFIRVVYADDDNPPSVATIRRRCPVDLPGAFRDGRRWRIDLDTYYLTMQRRLQGLPEITPAVSTPHTMAADAEEAALLDDLADTLS